MQPARSSKVSAVKDEKVLRQLSVTVAILEQPPSFKLLSLWKLLEMCWKPLCVIATHPETSRACKAVRGFRLCIPLSVICIGSQYSGFM